MSSASVINPPQKCVVFFRSETGVELLSQGRNHRAARLLGSAGIPPQITLKCCHPCAEQDAQEVAGSRSQKPAPSEAEGNRCNHQVHRATWQGTPAASKTVLCLYQKLPILHDLRVVHPDV